MRAFAVVLLSLSLGGCAAAFRGKTAAITVDSTPPGAEASARGQDLGPTPAAVTVERKRPGTITLAKPGYETATVAPKRKVNGGWLAVDLATCIVPVALCIPLLVDAISGRWYDVKDLRTSLKPENATAPAPPPAVAPAPSPAAPVAGPPAEMSESERKATARAAYLEGIKLQEGGDHAGAIARFEIAQKYFQAPTHLLHLGQCQAASGKLVEAHETYEALTRVSLAKDAPEAFRQAHDDGKKALAALKPRIPTLKIQLAPPPSSLTSLVVKLNGNTVPNEVLSIARPVNPGKYSVMVWATGYRNLTTEIDVGEGNAKVLDLKLTR
jgi:hypothetical protein